MMNRTAIRKLENEIACAIHFDGRVMISGERGTGKKFVAHLIHQRSRRRTAPFVIASHRGFAESVPQAQDGTLLIDGVEELTVPMQLQLQQFLESGMTNGTPRLMTATGPDMFERVRSDAFGTDLFYRLNIIRLLIPALREHPEDIPILLEHYLSSYAKTNIPRLFTCRIAAARGIRVARQRSGTESRGRDRLAKICRDSSSRTTFRRTSPAALLSLEFR